MVIYVAPKVEALAFHCPHCGVYAKQSWHDVTRIGSRPIDNFKTSDCFFCRKLCYWMSGKILYPSASLAPLPHEDMPEGIIEDYNEARDIVSRSPRGAAALLRLCVQKLMPALDESGKNIAEDIKSLVKKGLDDRMLKAFDSLRVMGNESVHPGTVDMRDNQEVALRLFELLNQIIEEMISRPKRNDEVYNLISDNKKILPREADPL